MSLLVFLAVTLLGTGAHPLTIVDEFGKPVAAARVDFSDERGAHDLETSDALGSVAAREGFVPLAAEISAVGFATLRVDLRTSGERIALLHSLPVVGTVSVATGTQSSLHELPLAASVLDRNAIALSPSLATDALLRQLPGFDRIRSNSAFTNYGQLRVSFAGAGTDLGVVIADGLPAQDGFGGQVDWLAYPVQSLQSAELLRGAGSALYGSGAIGGVLSLTTFAPRTGSQGAEGRAMLGAGTNSSFDDGIQLSVPLGPTLAASASTATTGMSYFTLPPGYSSSRDHAAKGNSDATNVKLRYDDGATSIEAGGLFAWDAQDEGRTNYSFNRSLSQGGIVANHAIGAALAQFWYYERSVSILNVADLYPTHPGALRYVQNVPTNEQGYAATIGTPLSKNTALEVFVEQRDIAGVSTQHGPKDVLQALGSGTEIVGAAGLQATLRLSRFELLAGVRADLSHYNDLTLVNVSSGSTTTLTVPGYEQGAISPRIAMRYDLTSALALRLSAGGGFRTPYLNELVRGYNIGKVTFAPNPYLVPERGTTGDFGLDYLAGPRSRIALDVFATQVNDAIDFVTLSPTLMKRENLERTQTNGATLTYSQRFGTCTRLSAWGNAQNARVTSGPGQTGGKQLSYVPDQTAGLSLEGAGNGPFSFSLQGSYAGETYADDLEAQSLGSALLVGATARVASPGGLTIAATADNVLHQQYLSTIDRFGPPLTVQLRLIAPLGPAPPGSGGCGRSLP